MVQQQFNEGQVLAPAGGRVLKKQVAVGSVVLPGDPVAMIAQQDFKLRLRVPERHARFLKAGDKIRVDGAEFGDPSPKSGVIDLVYPQIEDGRVIADATVENLGEYFVGDRLRVWISGGERMAFVIPADLRHHALRHRLRPGPRRPIGTISRAGAARAESGRAPIFPTASKSCPAFAPATSWCNRESSDCRAG